MTDALRIRDEDLGTATRVCATCGKPATCHGAYEGHDDPPQDSCDDCCGHGNEDGWCRPIEGY